MLLIECEPSVCPGGVKCENQFFQKRMYPPLYTFNTGGKGWGLKVETDLKKGTLIVDCWIIVKWWRVIETVGDFVIEYVGEVIDHGEFLTRLKSKQDAKDESYYFLTLDNNRVIDAGPRGNLAFYEPFLSAELWNTEMDGLGWYAHWSFCCDGHPCQHWINFQLQTWMCLRRG